VSCPRITEAFGASLSADYEAHLKTCEECRSARAAYVTVGRAAVPPPRAEGLEQARTAAQKELTLQPRARPWWMSAVAMWGVEAALVAGGLLWLSLRQDAGAWLAGALWWGVAAFGVAAALAPGRVWSRVAVLGATAVALAVTASGALSPGGPDGSACAQVELLVSLAPIAVVLFALTRFAFDPLRAAVAGAAAAAVGVGLLCVHCPITATAHVALFHLLPWLVLTGVAWAVRRALPSRSLAP
jgi:hypothetical protein